jgi:hypothetical protein
MSIEIKCRRTTIGDILRLYPVEYPWLFEDARGRSSNFKRYIALGRRYLIQPEAGNYLDDCLAQSLYLPHPESDYLYLEAYDEQGFGSDVEADFQLLEIHPDGAVIVVTDGHKILEVRE